VWSRSTNLKPSRSTQHSAAKKKKFNNKLCIYLLRRIGERQCWVLMLGPNRHDGANFSGFDAGH
jgi:hypothetical protein